MNNVKYINVDIYFLKVVVLAKHYVQGITVVPEFFFGVTEV